MKKTIFLFSILIISFQSISQNSDWTYNLLNTINQSTKELSEYLVSLGYKKTYNGQTGLICFDKPNHKFRFDTEHAFFRYVTTGSRYNEMLTEVSANSSTHFLKGDVAVREKNQWMNWGYFGYTEESVVEANNNAKISFYIYKNTHGFIFHKIYDKSSSKYRYMILVLKLKYQNERYYAEEYLGYGKP